jgi:regulator of replication initiation timing
MNNDRLVEIMGAATTEIDTLRAQLDVARMANIALRAENNNLKQWQEAHKKEITWHESATH